MKKKYYLLSVACLSIMVSSHLNASSSTQEFPTEGCASHRFISDRKIITALSSLDLKGKKSLWTKLEHLTSELKKALGGKHFLVTSYRVPDQNIEDLVRILNQRSKDNTGKIFSTVKGICLYNSKEKAIKFGDFLELILGFRKKKGVEETSSKKNSIDDLLANFDLKIKEESYLSDKGYYGNAIKFMDLCSDALKDPFDLSMQEIIRYQENFKKLEENTLVTENTLENKYYITAKCLSNMEAHKIKSFLERLSSAQKSAVQVFGYRVNREKENISNQEKKEKSIKLIKLLLKIFEEDKKGFQEIFNTCILKIDEDSLRLKRFLQFSLSMNPEGLPYYQPWFIFSQFEKWPMFEDTLKKLGISTDLQKSPSARNEIKTIQDILAFPLTLTSMDIFKLEFAWKGILGLDINHN